VKCNYKRIIMVYGGNVYLGDSTYSVAGVVKALIGLAIVRAQQLRILNNAITDALLGSEEFRKEGENLLLSGFVDLAHALDKSAFVYGSDLIQHNLS
jgi:hypothetical protein